MKQQDIDDLRKLIDFLKAHQVAEFDLDRGDLKIRLKFHEQQAAAPANLADLARLLATAPAAAAAARQHRRRAPAARRRSALPIPMPGCTSSNRRLSAPFTVRPRPARRRLSRPATTLKRARSSASSKP